MHAFSTGKRGIYISGGNGGGEIREVDEKENDTRSAGYFEGAFLIEIGSRERGVEGSGDEQRGDRDGHHGSRGLSYEAIV